MNQEREKIKQEILSIFNKNVRGKIPDLSNFNSRHDGAEGDWLTKKMGLKVNGRNEPDYKGFEMKKDSSKTTFGDWAPDQALYKKKGSENSELSRIEFLMIFGRQSQDITGDKGERYSWSGEVFPKVKFHNDFGQIIKIDDHNNVLAIYDFEKDKRTDKFHLIPENYQKNNVVLAAWSSSRLKTLLERKFNNCGWFNCIKDSEGKYERIQFGLPINFQTFINFVRTGEVFCDCGMYSTNPRPYMTWRASKRIWDSLAE
jgi:hypothetical protein